MIRIIIMVRIGDGGGARLTVPVSCVVISSGPRYCWSGVGPGLQSRIDSG